MWRPSTIDLTVATGLALAAGSVDAIGFTRVFDVFPANQSGNVVHFGMDIGGASTGSAWRSAAAIVGFAVGIAAAILLGSRVRQRARAAVLLSVEVVLLTPLTVVLIVSDSPRELTGAGTGSLIVLTGAAMGIQTEVIRRVAGVKVATTYQSGAVAHLGEDAAHLVRPAADHTRDRLDLAVLLAVLIAYVVGAALGAALDDWNAAMLVPVAVIVAIIPFATHRDRDRPSASR